MSNKPTSGPAFPCGLNNPTNQETIGFEGEIVSAKSKVEYSGMTLRDCFAAKAMQGQIQRRGFTSNTNPSTNISAKAVAAWAYQMADAMMEARKS